jgi:hypothetical protein
MRLLGVATLALAASCASDATAPAPAAPSTTANRLLLGSPQTVSVVRRDVPLAAPLQASKTVGLLGGVIKLPGAGLQVIVPPLAVTRSTRITVTALAGDQLAYEFEPHGIHFLTPLLVTQNLNGTSAVNSGGLLSPLVAGYFASTSDLNPLNGTGLVSELLGVVLNLSAKTATFPVFHFSGYLIATGEDRDYNGASQ